MNTATWLKRAFILLCYLGPLLVLETVAPAATWRDFLRTGCGPAASTLVKFGFSPDDVATYAVPFGLVWPAWLVLVWFSPLRRLPLGLHALLGVLWCFGGCCGLDADALKQFLR